MKRPKAILLTLLLSACLAGCTPSVLTMADATPAPEPTPAPVGMVKAFGKEASMAFFAGADNWFEPGVLAQAELLGIPVVAITDITEAADHDVLIACKADAAALAGVSVPVVFYAADEADISDHGYGIVYDSAEEPRAALEAMFTYPSHEAPVRLIGLFPDMDCAASSGYVRMQREGKLQSKGACAVFASDGIDPEAWAAETLDNITVGVLDTVFAADETLARAAFAALKAAERNDAVEVCTQGLTPWHVEAMLEDHFLMGTAVGANEYGAGMLAVRMAAFLLSGRDGELAAVTLQPLCVRSDEVTALYREGVTEPMALITALDTEMSALYTADFLDELAEHAV